MTFAEVLFWVCGLLALNNTLFLLLSLAPLLWKWHQEVQTRTKLTPVPLAVEPNRSRTPQPRVF